MLLTVIAESRGPPRRDGPKSRTSWVRIGRSMSFPAGFQGARRSWVRSSSMSWGSTNSFRNNPGPLLHAFYVLTRVAMLNLLLERRSDIFPGFSLLVPLLHA